MVYRFTPILKRTPWGGDRICHIKGLDEPELPVGESWELSDLPGMESVVAEGPEAGYTLSRLISAHGVELLGERVMRKFGGRFPILLKLLDSRQWLSLQVHPDDETARAIEGAEALGKHEMWHVISAEPHSRIILGFKDGIEPKDYISAEGTEKMLDIVNVIEVEEGMEFNINPGTVHALGPGCLVAEVQQPCDLTYRIYDHGRPRELHLEKARRALHFIREKHESYYHVKYHELAERGESAIEPVSGSFVAVMVLNGSCAIDGAISEAGQSLLISADHGMAHIKAGASGVSYLTIDV